MSLPDVNCWKPGDQILIRYRRPEPASSILYVLPVTVVEDGPGYTAVFAAAGTPVMRRMLPDGRPVPRDLPYAERYRPLDQLGPGLWNAKQALKLFPAGAAHDVRFFWSKTDWAVLGGYVNLQAPVCRVSAGLDTVDHELDIVFAPDLSWKWKDEDEFAEATRLGVRSADQAAVIRAEGEQMVEDIEARRWPFNVGYQDWRPDPSWPIPTMPTDWDTD